MLSSRSLPVASFVAMVCACTGPDEELAWNVGESRQLVAEPANASPVANNDTFEVFAPLGLQRFRLGLVGRESVVVEPKARVLEPDVQEPTQPYGFIASLGEVTIGAGAEVGSIYGLGKEPVTLGEGVTVHGYVKAHSGIRVTGEAKVTVGIMVRAPESADFFRWKVEFPRFHAPDASSAKGGSLEFEPGAYESLPVNVGRIRLGSGHYFWKELVIAPETTIEIDNSKGPVYLWVRDEFRLLGKLVTFSTEPNVLIGYASESSPDIRAALNCTLVAPAARVHLPNTATPHRGSVFAKSVRLEASAVLEQGGFWPNHVKQRPFETVCSECARAMRYDIAQCCGLRSRASAELEGIQQRCWDACSSNLNRARIDCVAKCTWNPPIDENELEVDTCLRDSVLKYDACVLKERYQTDSCVRRGFGEVPKAFCERE